MYELIVKEEKMLPEFQTIEYTFSISEELKGKTVTVELAPEAYKKDITFLNVKYLVDETNSFKLFAKCLKPAGIRKYNVGELLGYLEVI